MKTSCDCCGTCCRNGGPPLHTGDRDLVTQGLLSLSDLVTVRRGEFVILPMARKPIPTQEEWIKIQGRSGSWSCRYLDEKSSICTIYTHRPLSCRTLKCWEPEEIVAMAGRDLLCRTDLINENDPLLQLVQLLEERCPVPDLQRIASYSDRGVRKLSSLLPELTSLVNEDLQIRSHAAANFSLPVELELFYFGRPLFQILRPFGIVPVETPHGVDLQVFPG